MKIAIIENDANHVDFLRRELHHDNWTIDYYYNSTQFGFSNIHEFDVIIADYALDTLSGRDLIKSISTKTSAQLYLMSDRTGAFSEDDVNNQNIAGFINKNDIDSMVHQLEYSDVKIRLNRLIETDHDKYKEILHNGTPDYTMREQDGILVIEVYDIITNKTDLEEKIHKSGKNKAVISFNSISSLSSSMLGELTYLYKIFKKIHGEIVFWNAFKSELIERTIKECRLDRIIKLVDYLDDAIKYLSQI